MYVCMSVCLYVCMHAHLPSQVLPPGSERLELRVTCSDSLKANAFDLGCRVRKWINVPEGTCRLTRHPSWALLAAGIP